MDMKRTLLLAALIGAIGAFADSYLYWMIDTEDANNNFSTYGYARIKDTTSDTYLSPIYDVGGDFVYNQAVNNESGVGKDALLDSAEYGDGFFASLSGVNLSTASFIIELYTENGTWLAQSSALSGSAAAGYIYSGGISVPPSAMWVAGSFAVPEPTSGLLMLLGMAGLALRRKKSV